MNNYLQNFKKTIHSQWGEDGLLSEIFQRIGATNKVCVEFGAGNGTESSNVWHLINDLKWNGFLMEADNERFAKWKEIMDKMPNLTVLNTLVEPRGEHSLDNIFKNNNIPHNLDLLSIDVDGYDYYIFENLNNFKPRVIIIEHNPTIGPELEIIQPVIEKDSYGSSALANVKLAHKKGYKLAAATHGNCIFVLNEEFSKLNMNEPSIEEIFDRSGITYIVSSYYGSTFLRSTSAHPSFSYLYNGASLKLGRSNNRSLSLVVGFHSKQKYNYAEGIPKEFTPVKILKHINSDNMCIIGFVIWPFKQIIKKFTLKK